MSIEQQSGKNLLVPRPPPPWGEIAPEGQTAAVVRFILPDRVVSYPHGELKRWEHAGGEPEVLTINAGKDQVVVEARKLAAFGAPVYPGPLSYPRPTTRARAGGRPGTQVKRIAIEPA